MKNAILKIPLLITTGLLTLNFKCLSPGMPANQKIVYERQNGTSRNIYIMDVDGQNKTQLTFSSDWQRFPTASRNGSKIIYTFSSGTQRIWTMNIDGSNKSPILYEGSVNNTTISQDGTKLVFNEDPDGPGGIGLQILIMNMDGSNVKQLTNTSSNNFSPSFSVNSDKIVYQRGTSLYIFDLIKNQENTLLNYGNFIGDPSFSPDGKKIVFAAWKNGSNEIFTIDNNGKNLTQITENSPGDNSMPSFSADGSKIVFARHDGSDDEIFIMNADGSNVVQLTDNNVIDIAPCFVGKPR